MALPDARAGLGPIIGVARGVIGMVHLAPLPGSPRGGGSRDEWRRGPVSAAGALAEGGADALLVENFHDVPFTAGRVDAATVAAMAAVARRIADATPLPLGINVLRSDGRSALAVAVAVGARFIRVNVHVGATLTDQGIIQGDAHALLRERRLLGAQVRILADVRTKHAAPLAAVALERAALAPARPRRAIASRRVRGDRRRREPTRAPGRGRSPAGGLSGHRGRGQ